MLYVSTDTKSDTMSSYIETVVIKDTEDEAFMIKVPSEELWSGLKAQGVVPQQVVGLFKIENRLLVTPVSGVELKVLQLLQNPHFFVRDKLGQSGASAYTCYGLYNFTTQDSYFSSNVDNACSVAKLLLESCGEAYDREAGSMRLETTRDYIAVCVDNTKFQSLFLRFDIADYNKVTRAYTKYKMLNMGGLTSPSMVIHVDE